MAISSFELYDYIPPIISDLIEAGKEKNKTSSKKGVYYEKKVALAFEMLDFNVEGFGQGTGREPDAIVTYRKENIAFIIDAKVRPNGYSIGTDDRKIKEYISNHLNNLMKEGYSSKPTGST